MAKQLLDSISRFEKKLALSNFFGNKFKNKFKVNSPSRLKRELYYDMLQSDFESFSIGTIRH